MSPTARNFFVTVLAVIVGFILLRVVVGVALHILFNIVLPTVLVVGGLYLVYRVLGGKALSAGRRTLP